MKTLFIFISLFLSANLFHFSENKNDQSKNPTCISDNEKALYHAVNEYRGEHNLTPIPLSTSLTIVAQTHVRDLVENEPFDNAGNCNPHSWRSEEHTSELQSRPHLVCRLLLEKKKKKQ